MDRHHFRATAQRGDLGDTPQAGHGDPRDTGRLDGERYDRNQRIAVFLGQASMGVGHRAQVAMDSRPSMQSSQRPSTRKRS